MRTTLDLPEELLIEAMKLSHSKTKTSAIILALKELIQKNRISELKKFKGSVNLDLDLNMIRSRDAHYRG